MSKFGGTLVKCKSFLKRKLALLTWSFLSCQATERENKSKIRLIWIYLMYSHTYMYKDGHWDLKKVDVWKRCLIKVRFKLVIDESNQSLLTSGRCSEVVVMAGLTVLHMYYFNIIFNDKFLVFNLLEIVLRNTVEKEIKLRFVTVTLYTLILIFLSVE